MIRGGRTPINTDWLFISESEKKLTYERLEQLRRESVDKGLANLPDRQDLTLAHRSKMYELRIAGMLLDQGKGFQHERKLGVSDSSVDFAFTAGMQDVFMEAVSIEQSKAMSLATQPYKSGRMKVVRSDAPDQRKSQAGELIKIQEKIGEKVWKAKEGAPTKFPAIGEATHLIVCDVRGYSGGDVLELKYIAQMIYGFRHLQKNGLDAYVRSYENREVTGLFDDLNTREHAAKLQERIHAIGISLERNYHGSELAESIMWFSNPFISDAAERAKSLGFGIVYSVDFLHEARGFVYQ